MEERSRQEHQMSVTQDELYAYYERHHADKLGLETMYILNELSEDMGQHHFTPERVDYYDCKMFGLWGRE